MELEAAEEERGVLAGHCLRFMEALGRPVKGLWSPIVPFVVPGNDVVKALAAQVRAAGFDLRPILSPTVPEGEERLRIVLHSFNTAEQMDKLATLLLTQ